MRSDASATPAIAWSAWGFLAFLTVTNLFNILDRQLLSAMGPLIIDDLELSYTQFGLLAGPLFIGAYSICALVLGNLADRLNRPRLIAVGLALWSGFTALTGVARDFAQIAAARLVVGVGEAALGPAAISMIADRFPADRRALATGIYYLGVPIGASAAFVIAALLAPTHGWRVCFIVLGVIGLLLVPAMLLMREVRPAGMPQDRPSMAAMVADYRRYLGVLKRVPAAVLVLAFIVLTEFALGAMALAVTYLVKEQGMALKTASLTIGLVFLSAGIIGNVLGGALGDWAEARRPGGRLWFLGLTNLAALPFGLAFLLLPAGQTSILLIGACVFMLSLVSMMRYGPMFAAVQDFAPPTLRATAIATTLVVMGVLGNSLGPLIAGMIGDAASLRLGLLICLLVGGCASIPALWAAQRFSADQARARATWSTATPPS